LELRRPAAPAGRPPLRSCPFCGVAPETVAELRRFEGFQARTLHQVTCHCGAAGPTRISAKDAADGWNNGASSAEAALHPAVAAMA
jgi:Lar family restriction alleviation protein